MGSQDSVTQAEACPPFGPAGPRPALCAEQLLPSAHFSFDGGLVTTGRAHTAILS